MPGGIPRKLQESRIFPGFLANLCPCAVGAIAHRAVRGATSVDVRPTREMCSCAQRWNICLYSLFVIRALRRTRLASLFAAVALFATMPVTVSSLLHDEGDDLLCNPALVVHDQDAHRYTAPEPATPDSQHCVLCHALQSIRAVQASVRFAPPSVDARLIAAGSAALTHALLVSARPARAPPLA